MAGLSLSFIVILPINITPMKQFAIQNERQERSERSDVVKLSTVRLIQQNRRLQAEIQKLDQVISTLIEKNISSDFEYLEQSQDLKLKYHKDQDRQLRQIARLKKEIKKVKTNIADNKWQEVKEEENMITYLKMQYQKMYSEKQTLLKKKSQKEEALQFYKPLNNQTAATFERYRKTKSENADLKRLIHQVQKQVNRYHKIREMAKSSVPKTLENYNYQFLRIDNEIQTMKKEMRKIQDKWKGKLEVLDKEYFSFKTILIDKEQSIENLEKQTKNWDNKSVYYRDQNSIAIDRQRVSSIVISPKKRKEMQEFVEQAKRSRRRVEPKPFETKKKLKEKTKSTDLVAKKLEIQEKPVVKEELPIKQQEPQQVEKWMPKEEVVMEVKEAQAQEPKKPSRAFENVGVGTSFYYAED